MPCHCGFLCLAYIPLSLCSRPAMELWFTPQDTVQTASPLWTNSWRSLSVLNTWELVHHLYSIAFYECLCWFTSLPPFVCVAFECRHYVCSAHPFIHSVNIFFFFWYLTMFHTLHPRDGGIQQWERKSSSLPKGAYI